MRLEKMKSIEWRAVLSIEREIEQVESAHLTDLICHSIMLDISL